VVDGRGVLRGNLPNEKNGGQNKSSVFISPDRIARVSLTELSGKVLARSDRYGDNYHNAEGEI